ncbi:hypothetical protein GJ496_001172 [Pomphorhynchus laevis]|nr:hypothetical protein GJ496_001172 [Pomphorhynchus laevis]
MTVRRQAVNTERKTRRFIQHVGRYECRCFLTTSQLSAVCGAIPAFESNLAAHRRRSLSSRKRVSVVEYAVFPPDRSLSTTKCGNLKSDSITSVSIDRKPGANPTCDDVEYEIRSKV